MRFLAIALATLWAVSPVARAETRFIDFDLAWSNQDLLPGAGVRTVGALFDGPTVARLTMQDVTFESEARVQFSLQAMFSTSGLPFGLTASPAPSIGTLRFGAPGGVSGSGLASLLERSGPNIASAAFGSFSVTVSDGLDPAGDSNLSMQHGLLVSFTNIASSAFNDGESARWQLPGRVQDYSFEGANRPLIAITYFRSGSLPAVAYGGVNVENVANVSFTGQVSPIPEPRLATLMLAGLALLLWRTRRRSRFA
jgi:hypothetical protein